MSIKDYINPLADPLYWLDEITTYPLMGEDAVEAFITINTGLMSNNDRTMIGATIQAHTWMSTWEQAMAMVRARRCLGDDIYIGMATTDHAPEFVIRSNKVGRVLGRINLTRFSCVEETSLIERNGEPQYGENPPPEGKWIVTNMTNPLLDGDNLD